LQVYCDAGCPVCVHKRRKDTHEEGEDVFYYCNSCRNVYLCTFPLTRKVGIRRTYECLMNTCKESLSSVPLSKAFEIGLSSKITTRFLNGTLYKNVWTEHNAYQSKRQRELMENRVYWFDGGDTLIDTDVLDDHAEFLKGYDGLTVPIMAEVLARTQSIGPEYLDFPAEKDAFIDELKNFSKRTIEILYRILEGKKLGDYSSLAINLMVRNDLFDSKFISSNIPVWLQGIVNLIGISNTGKFTWFIIVRDAGEDDFVNNIMNDLLSLHSLNFANLEKIYVISDQFSWITQEILKKQSSINTSYGKAYLKLFMLQDLTEVAEEVS